MTIEPIPVGISACLLGNPDNGDGEHQRLAFTAEALAPYLGFESVYPEMAIALSVLRPALRLLHAGEGTITLCASNGSPRDVTHKMDAISVEKASQLQHLCGYIACSTSPRCGIDRVKVDEEPQRRAIKSGVALFTRELMRQMPWLPIEDDDRLHDPSVRENFIGRVYALHELQQLWRQGLSRGALIGFHSRYKLLLLAHSQPAYRELGRFVADIDQWASLEAFAKAYRLKLMKLLAFPATRRNHTNVLMHVQGYFRGQLNTQQRQELTQLIDRYRQGLQPLLAPITLLKHYMTEYPDAYLSQQRYFESYPDALRLRNGHSCSD
ncbi:YbgA family protein [Pectobacterium sp. B1J-3]|uniref:YbgA family protein n=1 Tax=Pectobacterium sp. B1J-3 TaxID=3385371 RepID=UPI00390690D2